MTRKLGLALLVAATLPASPPVVASDVSETARAGDAAGPAVASGEGERARDGRRTMARLPANLGRGAIGVFHAENLVPLLAGGMASATASFADEQVRNSVISLDWGDAFETGAGPVWSSLFVAGMFTAGRLSDGPRFRAMTYDLLDAAIVNFAYSEVIKVAVGRERPNGEDNKSFPSGHTSNAFALAAVAERLEQGPHAASLQLSPIVGRQTRGVRLALMF